LASQLPDSLNAQQSVELARIPSVAVHSETALRIALPIYLWTFASVHWVISPKVAELANE
jgi:hypothetical protein